MDKQPNKKSLLIENLHLLYLDHHDKNLHEALKSFLKQQGVSNPDKDPRLAVVEKEKQGSTKTIDKLCKAYEADTSSQMVYVEFDDLGYYQDPLSIKSVKTTPKAVCGIVKTHEGEYKKVSVKSKFYISDHMQTSKINKPKCYILASMNIWGKTKVHKNYQEFDYNFDYDFGDL